jgi:hypothetical protein
MVHGSNEPRSNAHWPNCIGSILRVAKRVMQFSDATYLSIHPFICVSTYPVIYVYYVISSFLSYIYIYIYMYYIDTHNMPNVKVEPAGSQPVRHRPTAWCLSSMLLGRNYLPSSWRVLVLGIGPFSSAAQAWSKACMLLGGGDDTSSPDPMPGIRWRRMW